MPNQTASVLFLIILLILSPLQSAYGDEAWRENPQWNGREKTLRSGLRAGEAVQHLEYKTFFTRHVIVECYEGVKGFSIGLGWAEISIDSSQPIVYVIDGRKPGLVPNSVYSDAHFVQLPVEEEQSLELIAGFIKGLEVAFWTRGRGKREYEQTYSLKGFSNALDKACGWHPSFLAAQALARNIKY